MWMPVNELTEIDYEILGYISDFDSISMDDIMKRFSKKVDSVALRVSLLATSKYSTNNSFSAVIPNTSYLGEETEISEGGFPYGKNIFYITEFGKKVLQDHRCKTKSDSRLLWKINAKIPIIVAFVTTVLTNYLIPLLPLILQWFADLLSSLLPRL